jgi:hypothetical protein
VPCGLNRTDLNVTGVTYLHGFPITLPHEFGFAITLPHNFGNAMVLPADFEPEERSVGNLVTWPPTPAHFGNIFGGSTPPPPVVDYLLQEDGFRFELEDGSGFILLELQG